MTNKPQVIPRHWLYAPLAVAFAALLTLLAVGTPPSAGAQDDAAEGTPTVGVLGTPEAAVDCAAFAADPANAPSTVYQVDSTASTARYIVKEELRSVGETEAIGETQAIVGTVSLDANGIPMTCSRFDVDLRTLVSDESRRDNYLQGNTLETATYPLATFILTSVQGMDGALVEGEETTVTLIGELSLHGVTNVVAWETVVTLEGDTITGTAQTEFDMPDFGILPPTVGPVVSLEELVKLEFDLTLKRV
jgi:polyisoprenoid-binding protein YceI